jgi:hypothetical protein
MRDVIRFQAEEPVEVALKFTDGKDVEGRFGAQVLYTTTDDRILYLNPPEAKRIMQLGITKGELFTICKHEEKRGSHKSVSWDIRRVYPDAPGNGGSAKILADITETTIHQVNASSRQQQQHPNGTTAPAAEPPSQLETQLEASIRLSQSVQAIKAAILACHEGEKYAASIGYAVHFENEDVRALGISILIGMQQNGGQR